jgi:hypothetical protein
LWFQRKAGPLQRAENDAPVGADVNPRAGQLRKRPDPVARQVSDDVDLELARRLEADDLRLDGELVEEPALEALARHAADPQRSVRLHGEVDRLPPLRVGGDVAEGAEHREDRCLHVPLVHEHVLASHLAASTAACMTQITLRFPQDG